MKITIQKALEKIAGIDARRPLPSFAKRSLKSILGDAIHH
jgi:hypothetical protein